MSRDEFESLSQKLDDPVLYRAHVETCLDYRPALIPRILGGLIVSSGNVLYGRQPSYAKFRAIEIVARVPYHSWTSSAFTLLTLFFTREEKALELSGLTTYARLAEDNETMHVVVISCLAQKECKTGVIRHTVLPALLAWGYYWLSYFLCFVNPRYSRELNYLFERHAFEQYNRFLEGSPEELQKKPVVSPYLAWYGRRPENQYEFFRQIRNDELIHCYESIPEAKRRPLLQPDHGSAD